MDKATFIQRRKKRYMAQILEDFEEKIEPHLPDSASRAVRDFKGLVRHRLDALANDAADVCALEGSVNGAAQEIRDRLSPTGRP